MTETPGPELKEAALAYAGRGWKVFPCVPRGKVPCKEIGLFEHGVKEAASSRFWVTQLWRRWPTANVATAAGEDSGFWVLDADLKPETDEDGFRTLRELEDLFGEALPDTLGQITPSGGRHWLFRWPERAIPNSSRAKCGPGLDTRGESGYILVAPSIHPNGKRYVWTADPDTTAIVPAPEWLVRLVIGAPDDLEWLRRALDGKALPAWLAKRLSVPKAPADAERAGPPPGSVHPYARKALEEEAQKVRTAVPGSRNSTLNEAAFNLGQFIPGGYLPRSLIEQHLSVAALACFGSDQRELIAAQKTIKSGLDGGMQHPRELPAPLVPQRRGRSGRPAPRRPLRTATEDPQAVAAAVASARALWADGQRVDDVPGALAFLRASKAVRSWSMLRAVDRLDLTHVVPGQGRVLLHRGPAVLAAMQVWNPEATGPEVSGVLATWIDADGRTVEVEHASIGRPVPARRMFGRRGGAVRLSPLGDASMVYLAADLPLGLLCAMTCPDKAVWAVGGAVAMADVLLPDAVTDVLLLGAGDLSRERAASIAAALGNGEGRTVRVARTTAQKARVS
ncbi:hypothetical protein GAY33_09540 [Azospirillum brasilense]|uniref:bifunctional DNA primase/polymerase n=1 Tax=Azospirillum argentinense TaxID=2970906 RepID=UPI00190B3061|nr:bifunctional DNA primase/polymerase [Azospirillum argentinense]MBK3799466.1 hypothetical protein [Azospirillum argentinense]